MFKFNSSFVGREYKCVPDDVNPEKVRCQCSCDEFSQRDKLIQHQSLLSFELFIVHILT